MISLMPTEVYGLVWNHPPLPAEALLARVASPHARRTYEKAIAQFYWRIERDPCLATPPAIAEYLGVLQKCFVPRVAALHLRIVREFYDEGVAAGIVSTNPVIAVPPPKFTPEPPVQVPTRELAERRLPTCRCHQEVGRRERALCLLVCQTGSTVEEIQALQVSDYRQEEEGRAALHLRQGEAQAPVRMTLSAEAAAALDAYLASRAVADDSPLFGPARCRTYRLRRVAARGSAAGKPRPPKQHTTRPRTQTVERCMAISASSHLECLG